MFILINTFDLSVSSQPDGWSSSPIFVGNWVERDFETARVTSLGLVDTQAPSWDVLPYSHSWWWCRTAPVTDEYYSYYLAHFSRPPQVRPPELFVCPQGQGPPLPLQTPFSSQCWCHLLTAHMCFPCSLCLLPWAREDVALHAIHLHHPVVSPFWKMLNRHHSNNW